MALPKGLVAGQRLTWVGPQLPPPEAHVVKAGDVGLFVDCEGDTEHDVVEFSSAMFCCDATAVRAEPRPVSVITRRHHSR